MDNSEFTEFCKNPKILSNEDLTSDSWKDALAFILLVLHRRLQSFLNAGGETIKQDLATSQDITLSYAKRAAAWCSFVEKHMLCELMFLINSELEK